MYIEILEGQEKYSDICNMYWDIDDSGQFTYKVSDISNKYGSNSNSILKIVKQSCIAYSEITYCSACGVPFSYTSRANYSVSRSLHNWICPDCINSKNKIIEDEKENVLENALEYWKNNPIDIDTLSFRHAIFLLSLVRFCGSEDLTYIRPISSNKSDYLSPKYDFDLSLIEELYRNNVIAINPLSDLDAIELKEEGRFSFYLDRVSWLIPLREGENPISFIHSLEEKISSMEYVDSSYDEVVSLCKEISLLECLNYLDFVLAEHQLNFEAGEKTRLVLNRALESFSVSQVYNFIWRSAKDAAAFYLRSNTSKKHAANTIVGNIQKQCERALANNWSITAFRRNYDMPQSVISQVLFNVCLHTDDGGFSQKLNKVIQGNRAIIPLTTG